MLTDPTKRIDKDGSIVDHRTNKAIADGVPLVTPAIKQAHGGTLGGVKRVDENGNRHPRLCQGVRRDKPCGQWALAGVNYCKFCGGRRMQNGNETIGKLRVKDVSKLRFYRNRLAPKMKAVIEELLDNPESEQLRLNEELAIVRDIAGDAIALLSAARELPDDNPKRSELVNAGNVIALQALEQVRVYCQTAANIATLGKDKFSVHALHDVVSQITRFVYLCFDHDKEGLIAFDKMITDELRLPAIGQTGTNITPDMDVSEMDDSIPGEPDPDETDTQLDLIPPNDQPAEQ